MSHKPTAIAFIGATGGCANAALVLALQAGHTCRALARTPSKLTDMLLAAGVPQSTLNQNLTVVEGDIRTAAALQSVLQQQPASQGGAPKTVDLVVSGIGMVMGRGMDPNICKDAMRCVGAALEAVDPEKKQRPFVAAISSSGISDGPRDVPLGLIPLWKVALKAPHADKKVMEEEMVQRKERGEVAGYTLIRPTFLTGGEEKGIGAIRVGSVEKPAVGYTINRKDVGRWIFEELIEGDSSKWNGTRPTLTY